MSMTTATAAPQRVHGAAVALLAACMLAACAHDGSKNNNAKTGSSKHAVNKHGHHGAKHAHPGGAMHHRFTDAKKWAKRFESPKRARWQKPDKVVSLLGLTTSMRVADIGAGTGYFSARMAKQVPRGVVYAVDLEQSMVDYLKKRAASESLSNLRAVKASSDSPALPERVDLVFLCNTYHHIANRTAYFRRVAARLKPVGRLAIVDFKMGKLPVGPPEKHRVTPAKLDTELRAAGYTRASLDTKTLPYQYIAIYKLTAKSSGTPAKPASK